MFGIDDAALIASALAGGYETFFGGGMSKKDKEDLAWWENRSKEGLSTSERTGMTQRYAPSLARGVYAKQDRLSRMYASTGASDSSYARRAIVDIPGVGEQLTPIIAEADMNARSEAARVYHGLKSGYDERRQASVNAGLTALGQTGAAAMMKYGGPKPNPVAPDNLVTPNDFSLNQDAILADKGDGMLVSPQKAKYSKLRIGGRAGLPFQYGDWNLNEQWPYNYSWEN